MNVTEDIKLALRSIRGNLLRTVLTFMIIAFGIMALVGILTATDVMKVAIQENFTFMGSNSFKIRVKGIRGRHNNEGSGDKTYIPVSYSQAVDFKERFEFPSVVSISVRATPIATVKRRSEKTHPNVQVSGVDIDQLHVAGLELTKGRNFSPTEMHAGSHVALIGSAIADELFEKQDSVINQFVTIASIKYRVIGVMEFQGSSSFFNADNQVLIPVTNAKRVFVSSRRSYIISVMVDHVTQMEAAISEATGLMRNIRKLKLEDQENFRITKSDRIVEELIKIFSYFAAATSIIGLITLIGAAIGLMNIMLVSVTERTREIGISKAIGATRHDIRNQFLIEAIVICQIGGLLGIFLGILAGNVLSLIFGIPFVMPWLWLITGLIFCFCVGIASGLYPALKASRLDPIEALRFE